MEASKEQSVQCDASKCSSREIEEKERLESHLSCIGHKLLVMSGKGGVGKSSVAACLAAGLARLGFRVGLMDVDLHGPSIPVMLGITGRFNADENGLIPMACADRLKVVSMQCLLEDPDSAVIWRGPVKTGVIRQFISDVHWGDLDYLVIDSPPGTGDEPLSVAQTVPDARAVVVTTPQEVALADVRKSINFCRKVGMSILGLVENMSGLICPHCEKEIPLFGKGGGLKTAQRMDIPFLGSLPFDPRLAEGSDSGNMLFQMPEKAPFIQSLNDVIASVLSRCNSVWQAGRHVGSVA